MNARVTLRSCLVALVLAAAPASLALAGPTGVPTEPPPAARRLPEAKPATPTTAPDGKGANYVDAAIDAINGGKPVTTATTKAYGCSVKYGS